MRRPAVGVTWTLRSVRGQLGLLCWLALACVACSSSSKPVPRWLAECTADADCASSGACLCGRCTLACQDSCASGPAATVCTRTSSCGNPASGVCLSRCVQARDCQSGLSCREGFCTAPAASDASTIAADQPSLPGALTGAGTNTWARSFPGVAMMPPEMVRGSGGTVVVHVTSERLPTSSYATYAADDWLFRLDDTTGAMLWIEKVAPYPSVAVDGAGNVVLAWPTLLQKLDANGALLWSIPRPAEDAYEMAKVAVDGTGNIVVARTELDVDPGAIGGAPKGYLVLEKLGPDGTLLWQHRFGDGTSLVFGAFAAVDGAGNVVFWSAWVEGAVDFGGGPLTGKNVLAKYDAAGQHLWSKVLGGFASNSFPNPNPIVVDAAGNILVPNEVGGDPIDIGLGPLWCTPEMVFKFDPNGVPQWNTCLPVENLSAMPDGGFVTSVRVFKSVHVAGQVCTPGDEDDGALGLYGSDGQPLKSACLSQGGYQSYGAVLPDGTGTFLLTGASSGGLSLPGGLTVTSIDPSVWTAFVAKLAPWDPVP